MHVYAHNRHEKKQIYEKEGSLDEAIENYTQAADFFASENNKVRFPFQTWALFTMPRTNLLTYQPNPPPLQHEDRPLPTTA